ncbi:type II toxin-antitoxin system PemK/MazF family toxin [Trichothermofontia sp.]
MAETLAPGDIVLIALPSNQPRGREQEGKRPALVVGIPEGQMRYPMLFVAPLTTQKGDWVQNNLTLYPTLAIGTGGLAQESVVLLDQIRAVDVRRVLVYMGSLSPEEYQPIWARIKQIFRI